MPHGRGSGGDVVEFKSVGSGVLVLLCALIVGGMGVLSALVGLASVSMALTMMGHAGGTGPSVLASSVAIVLLALVAVGLAVMAIIGAIGAIRGGPANVVHRGPMYLTASVGALVAMLLGSASANALVQFMSPSQNMFGHERSPVAAASEGFAMGLMGPAWGLSPVLLVVPLFFIAAYLLRQDHLSALGEAESLDVQGVPRLSRVVGGAGVAIAAATALALLTAAVVMPVFRSTSLLVGIVFVLGLSGILAFMGAQVGGGHPSAPWRLAVLSLGGLIAVPLMAVAIAVMARGRGEAAVLPLLALGPLYLPLFLGAVAAWPLNAAYRLRLDL